MQDAHRKGKIDVATLMNESIPTGRDEIIHSSFTPFFLFIIAHASHQPSPCATVIESDIENGSAPSSRSSTCYTTTVRSLRLSSLLVWQHTRVRTSQEPREEHPRTLRNRGHDRCAKSALKYARREDHGYGTPNASFIRSTAARFEWIVFLFSYRLLLLLLLQQPTREDKTMEIRCIAARVHSNALPFSVEFNPLPVAPLPSMTNDDITDALQREEGFLQIFSRTCCPSIRQPVLLENIDSAFSCPRFRFTHTNRL